MAGRDVRFLSGVVGTSQKWHNLAGEFWAESELTLVDMAN